MILTEFGEFVTAHATQVQAESERLRVRARDAVRRAYRHGRWPHRTPVGYRPDQNRPGVPRLDFCQALLVLELYRRVAAGEAAIDAWRAVRDKGFRVSRRRVRTVLRQRMYTGRVVVEGRVVEGRWPVLVPAKLWDEVQQRLTEPA